jgi:putative spermidine/putrescine transport system substrate-binding protein
MWLGGRVWAATLIGALLIGTQVSPASAQASAPEKELLFGGFGGTLQRAMQTHVIRAFEKKFGVHVTYVTGTSTEMLAKVRAQGGQPQIEIIWTTETTHDQARALGVSEKLDPKIVTNLVDLTPSARMPGDVGVGMGMQALAIEYNTKVFQEKGWAAPTSWSDLWDPKFKGHVVAYNVPIGYAKTASWHSSGC